MFEAIATACQRCGIACRPSGDGNPDARLLRYAQQGVCVSCGTTQFLKLLPATAMAVARNGIDMFRNPAVQAQFARVMASGQADAAPPEIDWNRVVDNWNLPEPKRRRRSRH